MIGEFVRLAAHAIDDPAYINACRRELDSHGALVLKDFFEMSMIERVVADSAPRESDAFFAGSTHNVYLTDPDPNRPSDHPMNHQVVSTKGLIADDQIPAESPLRVVYHDPAFTTFLAGVLGIEAIFAYDDTVSSINVHFAPHGKELGWHFDNSSFAVTVLLQAPQGGGEFQYVPDARASATGDQGFDRVAAVLNGDVDVLTLAFAPGDLVLFRGRDALHRVTPTVGPVTRLLTVFAYNDQPGIGLSRSARQTFYGR